MMDKRYWLATCEHGDAGFSTYAMTKEDFERQCAHLGHAKEKGCAIDIKEISQDSFAAHVQTLPKWVKQVVKLRREATRKIFPTLEGVRSSDIPCATIDGWRIRLSVDDMDGKFVFHLSARMAHGNDASEKDMVRLGFMMQVMGAVPLPEIVAKNEAYHFRWDALDVEARDLN